MFRAPSQASLPPISIMLADLPASRAQTARHLGIAESTLNRYAANGQVPRAIMLALFWETRFGRSAADCEAHNYGQAMAGHAHALEKEIQRLRNRIQRLESLVSATTPAAANMEFSAIDETNRLSYQTP